MRQVAIISVIWLGLAALLGWSQYRQLEAPECLFLPESYRIECEAAARIMERENIPGPAYNHPKLKHFPNIVDKEGWRDLPPEFDRHSGPVVLPKIGTTFTLKRNERAAIGDNARFTSFAFEILTCDLDPPLAVIYAQKGNRLADVSFYYYDRLMEANDYGDPFYATIDWTDPVEQITERLIKWNGPRILDLESYNFSDQQIRKRHREFLEFPRSLTAKTGIPKIVTYATRHTYYNVDHDPELSIAKRTIVMPYNNGTLKLVTVTFATDGSKPVPQPWDYVWRNMTFPEGIPDNSNWAATSPPDSNEPKSLERYVIRDVGCVPSASLPPRWAWPKYAPKYQLPFWPYLTFG